MVPLRGYRLLLIMCLMFSASAAGLSQAACMSCLSHTGSELYRTRMRRRQQVRRNQKVRAVRLHRGKPRDHIRCRGHIKKTRAEPVLLWSGHRKDRDSLLQLRPGKTDKGPRLQKRNTRLDRKRRQRLRGTEVLVNFSYISRLKIEFTLSGNLPLPLFGKEGYCSSL